MDDVLTHPTANKDIQDGKLDADLRMYMLSNWRRISKKLGAPSCSSARRAAPPSRACARPP